MALGLVVLFGALGALAALAGVLSAIPGGRRALQSFVGHRPIAVSLARHAARAVPLYGISPIADDDPVRSEARIAFVSLHNHDGHQNGVTVDGTAGQHRFRAAVRRRTATIPGHGDVILALTLVPAQFGPWPAGATTVSLRIKGATTAGDRIRRRGRIEVVPYHWHDDPGLV